MATSRADRADRLVELVEPAQRGRPRCRGCCSGSRLASQRLLDQRRLGAVALLGDQRRTCAASGRRQIEGVAFLAHHRRSLRKLDDHVVVVDRRAGVGVASSGAGSARRSANSGRSQSGVRSVASCGVAMLAGARRARRRRCSTSPAPTTALSRRASVPRVCAAPVVGRAGGASMQRPSAERRRRQPAREEVAVGEVPELAGPDRRRAGDQHQRLVGAAAAGPRPASAAAAASPARRREMCDSQGDEPLARQVALRAQLGGGAERIGQALGRALVVGREGDAHVAVVEDGVVVRRRPCRSGCSDWATRNARTP